MNTIITSSLWSLFCKVCFPLGFDLHSLVTYVFKVDHPHSCINIHIGIVLNAFI